MNLNLLHNAMLFGVQSQYDRLFHVFIIYIFDDFQFISLSCIIPFRLVPLLFSQIGAFLFLYICLYPKLELRFRLYDNYIWRCEMILEIIVPLYLLVIKSRIFHDKNYYFGIMKIIICYF